MKPLRRPIILQLEFEIASPLMLKLMAMKYIASTLNAVFLLAQELGMEYRL